MRVGTGIIVGSAAALVASLGLIGWGLKSRKKCRAGTSTSSSIGEALAAYGATDPIPTDNLPVTVPAPGASGECDMVGIPQLGLGLFFSPLAVMGIVAGLGVYLIEEADS